MNSLDFVSGIDFTGQPNIQGQDVNNAVANGIPLKEADETVGKGLPITTTDSALGVPVVPDPTSSAAFTKWKRYQWIRRPFAGASDKTGRHYFWNDDAPNDAVYKKWVAINVDLTAITNAVNSAVASADAAVTEAQIANTQANQANTQALTAVTTADNASTEAAAANALAATANTNAVAAQTSATTAQNTAQAAQTLNTTPLPVAQRLTPGAAFQKIRTTNINVPQLTPEWFSESSCYGHFSEIYAKNTDNPTAAGSGKNTRLLNTTDFATIPMVLNPANGAITMPYLGYWRVRAWAIINRSGASAVNYQLILGNFTNLGSTVLTGSSGSLANGNTNNHVALLEGIFNNTGFSISLDMYISSATGVVFGKAANVHPDAGGHEIYAGLELFFLGA